MKKFWTWLCQLFTSPVIHYSGDNQWYYISGSGVSPKFWMKCIATAGPVPEIKKKTLRVFGPWYVEFPVNDTYYREVLPFSTWSVKGGGRHPINWSDQLVIDYLEACELL